MRSTDIPNGVVFRGKSGEPLLMDFDDCGNILPEVTELGKRPSGRGVSRDRYRASGLDILTFVHTVKGESQMLIKDLFSMSLATEDRKTVSVFQVFKAGKLGMFAKDIRCSFIKELEKGYGRKNKKRSKEAKDDEGLLEDNRSTGVSV